MFNCRYTTFIKNVFGGSAEIVHWQGQGCHYCLPKGRHSEAAHEKRLLCAQKCTRGGVGWGGGGVGWGGVGWGGVDHVGVGWGGVGWVIVE